MKIVNLEALANRGDYTCQYYPQIRRQGMKLISTDHTVALFTWIL